jgi:hypothetical protein
MDLITLYMLSIYVEVELRPNIYLKLSQNKITMNKSKIMYILQQKNKECIFEVQRLNPFLISLTLSIFIQNELYLILIFLSRLK